MTLETIAVLFRFYQVDSIDALLIAMDDHIKKLQETVRQLRPAEPAVRHVRGG